MDEVKMGEVNEKVDVFGWIRAVRTFSWKILPTFSLKNRLLGKYLPS